MCIRMNADQEYRLEYLVYNAFTRIAFFKTRDELYSAAIGLLQIAHVWSVTIFD